MQNVYDIAEYFIKIVNQSEDDKMTNLKLNKLLYYAQGVSLARRGTPLFDDNIEAWDLGPVVPAIYRKYKAFGKAPIITTDNDFDKFDFTEDELEIMLDVIREFGQYTGSELVKMTHQSDTPWSKTDSANEKVIDQNMIRDYFISHPVATLMDKINIPKVDVLPSEWYNSEEDAEWEAYL